MHEHYILHPTSRMHDMVSSLQQHSTSPDETDSILGDLSDTEVIFLNDAQLLHLHFYFNCCCHPSIYSALNSSVRIIGRGLYKRDNGSITTRIEAVPF